MEEKNKALTERLERLEAKYETLVTTKISNDSIGYVLRRFGFNDKVHRIDGNHYNISREEVQAILLHEGLNP